jgi:hypothetical protein
LIQVVKKLMEEVNEAVTEEVDDYNTKVIDEF